jgi:K+-transporting ATPase KdpF subunit
MYWVLMRVRKVYEGHTHGPIISWDYFSFLCIDWRFHPPLRALDGGQVLNGSYILTGLIALALLIYLILALLKPEWFE